MKHNNGGLRPFYLNEEFRKLYTYAIPVLNCYRGLVLIVIVSMLMLFSYGNASAQQKSLVVRLAKLQIDSVQLDRYKEALKEEIETSVRVEPGVLTLYAVSEKDKPANITVFEIYANEDAFKAHLETPHFKKYKSITKEMVKSLELIETVPIVLGAKAK